MKYYIYILVNRQDDSIGVSKSWRLLKPHELPIYQRSDDIPVHVRRTYEGFDTFEAAENWINQYGEPMQEYTVLPVIRSK